jgi:hypothetical protein
MRRVAAHDVQDQSPDVIIVIAFPPLAVLFRCRCTVEARTDVAVVNHGGPPRAACRCRDADEEALVAHVGCARCGLSGRHARHDLPDSDMVWRPIRALESGSFPRGRRCRRPAGGTSPPGSFTTPWAAPVKVRRPRNIRKERAFPRFSTLGRTVEEAGTLSENPRPVRVKP